MNELRPDVALEGSAFATRFQRHLIPDALAPALRAAFQAKKADGDALAWLDARHLVETDRARSVDDWAQLRLPRSDGRSLKLLDGTKFTCHGCGLCCEAYVAGPITEKERAAILARQAELAPHVSAPSTGWFGPGEGGTYVLGKAPSGACVFLGQDKLCSIHKHLGIGVKPFACRAFPLDLTLRPEGTFVSLRIDCETLARSRDDGQPLREQLDWVGAIASGDPPRALPPLVRAIDDAFVPLPLALAIEKRALAFLRGAPAVGLGVLAVRDLVFATAGKIAPRPATADLDAAEKLASAGSLRDLAAACPELDPGRALQALSVLLSRVLDAIPAFIAAGPPESTFAGKNDRLFADTLAALHGALAKKLGWPGRAGANDEEAARAAATSAGDEDPAVQDFVRSCLVQLVASSKPLLPEPGLVYGYAHLALQHRLARFGARLLASRRGARAATREDWNHALAVVHRSLGALEIDELAKAVVALYANLFESDDLPF